MKINYDVTLKGFFCFPRGVIPGLVKELGLAGFAKYIILVSQADFDAKHKNFSKIIRDDKVIGKEFSISKSTVYKSRVKLTKKGFLVPKDGISSLPSMEPFSSKLLIASSKKNIQITAEMLKDWKLFDEKHKEYVDGTKWNQV